MQDFAAKDPGFAERVRASFAQQRIMALLGAQLTRIEPSLCEIALPHRLDLTQQDGLFHAGALGTIADSAGGYAALTLMPAGSRVLSVEYRLHFLAPGDGERAVATGKVVRAGRTLTVCELEVKVEKAGLSRSCAWGSQTLIGLPERPGSQ